MNTHNATHVKTRIGTFQVKYHHNGGKVGSTSVKIPLEFNNEKFESWIQ